MTPRRRWLLVCAGLVLAALLAVTGPGLWVRFCEHHVVNNALVGKTERQVTQNYGAPVKDTEGYSPLGRFRPKQIPSGIIRTLVFEPRGLFHLEGGTLWAWFRQEGDVWVCFESCWFADGVPF
jgi:hypothetical protein